MTYRESTAAQEAAAVLDMWYGDRRVWRDDELPLDMDVGLSNPAYRDHEQREYAEHFQPGDPKRYDWRDGVSEGLALGVWGITYRS